MDDRLALLLAEEAKCQATYAFNAVLGIDENLRKNNEMFWFHMQMFLISSANVSKILWGSYESTVDRKKIRELLNTDDNSALKSRRLRNHFEHYDERLIDWNETSTDKNIVINLIGPDNVVHGIDPKDIMRHYNPEKGKVTFRGETFSLKPIVRELKRINNTQLPNW